MSNDTHVSKKRKTISDDDDDTSQDEIFPFLNLPPEIRVCVYGELFQTSSLEQCKGLYMSNSAMKAELEDEFFKCITKQLEALKAPPKTEGELTAAQTSLCGFLGVSEPPQCKIDIDFVMPSNFQEAQHLNVILRCHMKKDADEEEHWWHWHAAVRNALEKLFVLRVASFTIEIEESNNENKDDAMEDDTDATDSDMTQNLLQQRLVENVEEATVAEASGRLTIHANHIVTKPNPRSRHAGTALDEMDSPQLAYLHPTLRSRWTRKHYVGSGCVVWSRGGNLDSLEYVEPQQKRRRVGDLWATHMHKKKLVGEKLPEPLREPVMGRKEAKK